MTGEWMDNSVNRKVKITGVGTHPLTETVEVRAEYIVPYKCEYPSSSYGGHEAVLLNDDFSGQLSKLNLGAHSEIVGVVYICQSHTQSVLDNTGTISTNSHTEYYSERVLGKMTLTVSDDGNSMTGTFEDPEKGSQSISFTRLSENPDKDKYYPAGVIKTTTTVKIYNEPSSDSRIRYTAPSGTQLIFEDVILDDAGNPTWYRVVNGEGPVYSKNTGWIRATQITCNKPNSKDPGPVSLLTFSVQYPTM